MYTRWLQACLNNYTPDGSYFPIHKLTELEALTRSIAVHTPVDPVSDDPRDCTKC